MAVTSQIHPMAQTGEASVVDWKGAGRLTPSVIKPVVATIARQFVRRRLGHLAAVDVTVLRQVLSAIIGD